MSDFLFEYHAIEPATWVYLSSLLMIGLFFKFGRLWSVRNLDFLLLILLAPGLLMVHYGQRQPALVIGAEGSDITTEIHKYRSGRFGPGADAGGGNAGAGRHGLGPIDGAAEGGCPVPADRGLRRVRTVARRWSAGVFLYRRKIGVQAGGLRHGF